MNNSTKLETACQEAVTIINHQTTIPNAPLSGAFNFPHDIEDWKIVYSIVHDKNFNWEHIEQTPIEDLIQEFAQKTIDFDNSHRQGGIKYAYTYT